MSYMFDVNAHTLVLQASHNKLRSDLRTLELERAALLQTVTKLRHLVPEDVIAAENINLPTILHPHDIHCCTSPSHHPQTNSVQREGRRISSGSLSDLDHEVANFTSTSPMKRHRNKTKERPVQVSDIYRPASSNY